MKNHPLLTLVIIASLLSVLSGGCSKEYSASGYTKPVEKEDSFNLRLHFRPVADTDDLHFDSSYENFWKESYSVSAFKFYICRVDLINTDSSRVYHLNPDKYFLVDAADSTTWDVKLLASPFNYNRISFMIGVDSVGTLKTAHKGALDPAKGMFIDTATGYVLARLQGRGSGNNFDYSITGFRGSNSALRKPTLLFPFGQTLQITNTPGQKATLEITANANAWFFNPHQIKIKQTPSCTSPGLLAKDISENYSNMFAVDTVINQ